MKRTNLTRGQVRAVLRLAGEGDSMREIQRRTGVKNDTVKRIIDEAVAFDPDDDEVAISRALAGDGEVFQGLTFWERQRAVYGLREYVNRFRPDLPDYLTTYSKEWGVTLNWLDKQLQLARPPAPEIPIQIKPKSEVKRGRPPRVSFQGEAHPRAVLTEVLVKEIRAKYAAGGCSHRGLGVEYGLNYKTIADIVNRKRWAHVA